jgi:hypothetical protein
MLQLKNPFEIAAYSGPEYFCDRKIECEKLISALSNNRNVTLISQRRLGKTSLIQHVFYCITKKNKNIRCFYVDIFATQNLHDFVLSFGKAVIGKLDNYSESIVKQISSFFKSFRPVFSFDAITGVPTVSFDIKKELTEQSLQEIFSYLQQSGKRIYIAIDEFQQITEYPEKGVEALLRSYIQFLPNVKFIFSGSKKHIMDDIFSTANRPFFQSTQKMGLKEIPLEAYRKFALDLFQSYKKSISVEVFDYIYNEMSGNTQYVQLLLNKTFALKKKNCSIKDVNNLINEVLEEENATYKTYCELITKGQISVLRAIAREGKVSQPYDTKFMQKHNLTAPSSVRLALNALIDKTLVLKDEDNNYCVYDRFFSLWLKK